MESVDLKKMRVAIYIRVANKENLKEDSSIENQKSLITNYIKERGGVKSKELYIDNGFSGTTYNRPEFKKLMKDIKAGKFDTILVNDLSRFGRKLDVLDRIDYLKKNYNTDFISINDKIDTLGNKIFFDIRKCINEQYRKDLCQKTRMMREYKKTKQK